MFRRIVSTCVLIGFIAGQWAAVPHTHAHETDAEHGHSCPHVHLSWFGGSTHEHVHVHGSGAAHHHHAAVSSEDSAGTPKAPSANGDDHDEDAVYLPGEVPRAASRSVDQSLTLKWQAAQMALVAYDTGLVGDFSLTRCIQSSRAPDEMYSGCALYIALRALRI